VPAPIEASEPPCLGPAQQRQQGERRSPRAEQIGLHRLVDHVEISARRPRAGVVADRRVVDQRVAAAESFGYPGRRRVHAVVVGDVDVAGDDIAVGQVGGRPAALAEVTRAERDGVPAGGELAAHLEADPAVGAGDHGDGLRHAGGSIDG
jgi:hypothetical protein